MFGIVCSAIIIFIFRKKIFPVTDKIAKNTIKSKPIPRHSKMDNSKYDSYDNASYTVFCGPAQIEKDINGLYGIIHGINADGVVNEQEADYLKKWTQSVEAYRLKTPYFELTNKIRSILADGIVTTDELEDLEYLCEQFINTTNPYYNLITSGLQNLSGILSGINADHTVNFSEIEMLHSFVTSNAHLSNTWPYDDVLLITNRIINTKELTDIDRNFLNKIIDGTAILGDKTKTTKGISDNMSLNIADRVIIPERTFCITGESLKYSRRQIAEQIELYGGYVQAAVSGKLDYLIICDKKNACWAFASYGRKIEKVLHLQKNGKSIEVVYEDDLYTTFESMRV